jgi:3-hydroxymyristoyl/3-hydroxydecanoyl-(acyl carrier protein) dehydratase
VSVTLEIPEGGPLFEGHFPGRPILPGIAQLVLVSRALAPGGEAASVAEIPFARFRGVVAPGDRLDVSAAPRPGAGVKIEVRRAGALVANAALVFGEPSGDDRVPPPMAARAPRRAPALAALLPHRAPMLFVERLLGEADDGATAVGRVPSGCALVTGGRAPAFVALELAAQTAAVWEALRGESRPAAGMPRVGYLVLLENVVLGRPTIPADADLIASVRLLASLPPLSTYAVDVSVEGSCAATGTIGAWLSD